MTACSSEATAGTLPPAAGEQDGSPSEVAVVRLPIADVRGAVVGYELVFARGSGDRGPALNARAPASMLDGAFAGIGLDRLAGSRPVWLSVARDFLVAVGTPPVRPDRAVIQIAAYAAQDDLLALLRRLSDGGYTIALTGFDGTQALDELLEICSIVKVPFGRVGDGERASLVSHLRGLGAQVVATGVDDEETLAEAERLEVDLVQGAVLARPRTVLGRHVASA